MTVNPFRASGPATTSPQETPRDRAERAIAYLLFDDGNPAHIISSLTGDIFNSHHIGLIVDATHAVLKRGGNVCFESVKETIEQLDGHAPWFTPSWIVQIGDHTFLPALTDDYKRIILEDERFARFKQGAAAARTADDLERVCTEAMEAHRIYAGDDEVPIGEAVKSAIERMARIREGDEVGGHSWGIDALDAHNLLVPGTMTVVAGLSKGGKSQVALNTVDEAIGRGEPCFIASLEMSTDANIARLLSRRTGINSRKFFSRFVSDEEWEQIMEAAGPLGNAPLRINQFAGLTASDISGRVASWKRSMGIKDGHGIVFVDYLQLIPRSIKHGQNDATAIGDVARTLRATAKKNKVALVALTQFNKEAEGQKPSLRYIDGSQQIKATADAILMLDLVRLRSDDLQPSPDGWEDFNVIIYQRTGQSGVRVPLEVDLATNRFRGRGDVFA